MSVFKDFPGLENLEKNLRTFKDSQEPCITECSICTYISGMASSISSIDMASEHLLCLAHSFGTSYRHLLTHRTATLVTVYYF